MSVSPYQNLSIKMLPLPCCVFSLGHTCELILVYGDTLRALLSSTAVDSTIWNHISSPLEAELTYFCRDDLALHLGNVTDKDHLEDFLAMLLAVENLQVELGAWEDIRDEWASLSPITMEYEPDGDLFQETPDTEPLLPRSAQEDRTGWPVTVQYESDIDPFRDPSGTESPSSGRRGRQWLAALDYGSDRDRPRGSSDTGPQLPRAYTGEGRVSFRSHLASIERKRNLQLRHDYHQIPSPSQIPECPPTGDCSTCQKCAEAVESEW